MDKWKWKKEKKKKRGGEDRVKLSRGLWRKGKGKKICGEDGREKGGESKDGDGLGWREIWRYLLTDEGRKVFGEICFYFFLFLLLKTSYDT